MAKRGHSGLANARFVAASPNAKVNVNNTKATTPVDRVAYQSGFDPNVDAGERKGVAWLDLKSLTGRGRVDIRVEQRRGALALFNGGSVIDECPHRQPVRSLHFRGVKAFRGPERAPV